MATALKPPKGAWLAVLAALALGCVQSDSRCLVIVTFELGADVPPLAELHVSFATKKATVTDTLPTPDDPIQLGFFVPGVEGTVPLEADGLDAAGCTVAHGEVDVDLHPGQVVHATVPLDPVAKRCPNDAGTEVGGEAGTDAGGGADADGGAPDGQEAGSEAGGPDTGGGEVAPGAPTCQSYCEALTAECPENAETIGGAAACRSLCELFFPPSAGAVSADQLACRMGWISAPAAGQRCSAGGFSGGGLCGLGDAPHNWCDVYCEFASTVCDRFGMTPIQCVQNCTPIPDFPNASEVGNNVGCRIRQLVIAGGLQGNAREPVCDAAAIMPTTGPCR